MSFAEKLAQERRARLAAERMLEQKQRELLAANEKLARQAQALADKVFEQRYVARAALNEAETLKGKNIRARDDLDRAHAAAVIAERRLWESIETIGDGFAVYDRDRRLVVANPAYRKGFCDDEIAAGTPYATILRTAADRGLVLLDGLAPQDWCAAMLARWDADTIEPMTLQLRNGRYVKLIDRRTPDGDLVSLALDTTEMMRMWAAVETIPDGFVLYDRQDRMVMCNERYRQIYPESAAAMVPGATFEQILRFGLSNGQYADAKGREEAWLAERLAAHRNPSGSIEQNLGGGRWLRVLERETPDGGRVGLRVDISAMKEQQVALEQARVEAEAANRAKSAFLANMSHEIRTPMNGVVGMAELLCDTSLSEEQRLYAETIKSSGEALLSIINDVLDYSKIEADKLVLHPEAFDLERCIHEIAMLMQPSVKEKGIDLCVDFDMFLPTRFIGDPGRLRQVMTNLIGNAVKFTPSGHVLIRVVGLPLEGNSWDLHVTIEDTGIGIAPEDFERVFGEFNQVEEQANRKFEGTGLGLAITRRLIELMGGSVWVESEKGKGSCFGFQVVLPTTEEPSNEQAAVTLRHALVVDDKLINRTILERQLSTYGVAATLTRTGSDALAALAADTSIDIIVTDHEMPEMSGLAFAAQVRDSGYKQPILMLSSNPAGASAGPARDHLAAVLQKPVLRAELLRRLQEIGLPPALPKPATPQPAPARMPEPAMRKMRILAAEDNRTNQLVFSKMVKDLDIDLVFANNGVEAVSLFQSYEPDMIFMDISMPEMDGRDATRAIRALPGGTEVPIVALTAHAMDGDRDDILGAGLNHYLTKPLRKLDIVEHIRTLAPAGARPPCPDTALAS